ncbi:histidine kinase dimerization/phosphoacceptor domain -containing protein [Mucilaginibacter endophyticus]|uniref:histidine kinase dimerization/phosphoacceptor domain -containing protein n=1 Tax=Mucilaginibacter endophyticus TaxID=2675003 RepID=UPI000E0D6D80|nr:histidine kinase dimerization/phosphoacceptor domain -containing protein [Mucilaginibacter endophyticus]
MKLIFCSTQKRIIILLGLLSATLYGYAQRHDNITDLRKNLAVAGDAKNRIDLYLRLSEQYLNKPGELKPDLDSAMVLKNMALNLSREESLKAGEARAMLLDGKIRNEAGDKLKAKVSVAAALAFAEKHNLLIEQAQCYEAEAQFYDNENDGIAQKLQLQEKATRLYHEAGDREKEATALKYTGDYLHLRGRASEALAALQQALAIYKQIGFRELQGVYNLIGNVYTQMGNYHLSIKYELLSAQTAEALGDNSLQLSSIYNHIALTYYFLKQDKEALFYWEKAKAIAQKYNDAGYMQTILSNMATSWVRLKQYKKGLDVLAVIEKKYPPTEMQMKLRIPYIYFNTYMSMRQYANAAPYYHKLRAFQEMLPNDDANLVYLYSSIIRYMVVTKNLGEIYPFLQKQDALQKSTGNNLFRSENQLQWYLADSTAGHLKSAIAHYKLYKSLSDSVFNADKANQISSLQIQFETDQKDKNIKLLTQKNNLQAETIRKDNTIKQVIAGAVMMLLLLLALSYNRYRLKQKSNALLQAKQEEINRQYDILKKVLNEKEWLLREIHHRVKNNLQIVISLLNTQSAYINNQDAMDAIRNSQHRMHAMSLIHQKLYQSDSLATIDMKWYVHELVSYMRECFDIDKNIRFLIETDEVNLDVAQAVPLGLILNEAVTNAIKYAFPSNRFGTVSIILQRDAESNCTLIIADNGIGLPENFNEDSLNSLGMNLMKGLSEQLSGTFTLTSNKGLNIHISFPVNTGMSIHGGSEFEAA